MNTETSGPVSQGEHPFGLYQVVDRHHHGVVAWVFEHPKGWQARSEVVWNFANMSFPMLSFAQTFDPAGMDLVEFLPPEALYWLQPDYGFCVPGQNNLGQTCLQPMSAPDALARWLIPKYHGRRRDLRILGVVPMPQLAQDLAAELKGFPGEGVGARIAYSENGRPCEEEIYAVKVLQQVPYQGPMGLTMQINWGFAWVVRFRAEPCGLDVKREAFWRIARSRRINPRWEELCAGVMQQLTQQFNQYIQMGYSQIQAAGQLSQTISANNDALLRSFEQQRQAAHHTSAPSGLASGRSPTDGFDEYIRGVETVEDPYWGQSQQDSNYRYHWTDGQGNYQHSDDPFFNPNLGSGVDWTIMERRPAT